MLSKDDYISIIFVHWAMDEYRSQLSRASLKSLQDSIKSPAEIIVVDNGGNLEDGKFFLNECNEKRIAQYIRNSDNMYFGFARNQGLISASSNWIAIVDNDILYRANWIDYCVRALRIHKDKKLIASPINYPYVHQRDPRWRHGTIKVKGADWNLTERAGSNCMVMERKVLEEVGIFNLHQIAGSHFTDALVNAGYLVITPGVNQAWDAALRRGYNFKKTSTATRTLSDGQEIDFKNETFNNYFRLP